MSHLWYHICKLFRPGQFVVSLISKDGTVEKVGEWARCILYSFAVDEAVVVDWADGSENEVKLDDIACFLVTR